MSDVTVIGLGAMGGALVASLLKAGHAVTVWNRSPQKTEPFVKCGATACEDITEAVQASPRAVVCISDYAATKDLFLEHEMMPVLAGRTVIQLSTGTPREAREAADWMADHGIDYIDGAIISYPSSIGTSDGQILLAGPDAVYQPCRPFVQCFGGDVRYLGENIGAAATLDMAMICHELGTYLGVIHGALVCEAEGVGVESFASLFANDAVAEQLALRIHAGAYDNPGATISVWGAAVEHIQAHAEEADINHEIPDFILALCKRAVAAGYGEEDIAALFKLIQTRPSA